MNWMPHRRTLGAANTDRRRASSVGGIPLVVLRDVPLEFRCNPMDDGRQFRRTQIQHGTPTLGNASTRRSHRAAGRSERQWGSAVKSQRDLMREVVQRFGNDTERIISEYASAEKRGEVERERNAYGISPADYARRLWTDAVNKGWLGEISGGHSKTGVRIANTFRDNLIIDRYDPSFLTMRGAKTDSMRSENSEDVLTWNSPQRSTGRSRRPRPAGCSASSSYRSAALARYVHARG